MSPNASQNPNVDANPGGQTSRYRLNPAPSYQQRMVDTRAEVRRVITDALRAISNDPAAQMRWTPRLYMRHVVWRYHVRIVGWPLAEVPFKNLSTASNLNKLELLLGGWRDKTIRFETISDAQYTEMVENPVPWIGAYGPANEEEEEE